MNPDNLQSPNPSPTTPPVSPPSPPTNMQAPLNPISQSPQPKKSRKLGWILLIIVLLAAAIGGYLFYKHTHKTKIVTQTATKHDIALIKIGLGDGPVNSFYPADANTSGVTITNGQIFEGLVGWQNGTKVVPMLATSWTNPDDSSWVFTLRTNVKFHTGRTMTANDVKYSLEKLKDLAYGGGSGLGDTIKSVTVISPDKVKITTNGPDPILLNRLTFLYIVDSQSKLKDDSNNGTGPYVVKTGTDPVKDKVTDLVAFDNYWGGHIYTKELKISTLTDASGAITKLQSHQLDIFEQFTSLTEVKTLNADGINTIKEESSTVDMVVLNTLKKGSPLSNLKFRQAINIGIDRSAILKASDIEGTPLGQFVVKEIPGYDSSISVPEYNVIKAKK